MATYKEIFDIQIQKFKDLKEERDQKVEKLKSTGLTHKELIGAKKQIFDLFSAMATELRLDPNYRQAQNLRSHYFESKWAYETDEHDETKNEKHPDYLTICKILEDFASSVQEEGNNLIHKMFGEGASTVQINETFYRKGQDILTYFKDFCSGWSNNIHEEKEKNNSIIIEQLGLKEAFNNIYRRCIMFSNKYNNPKIRGIQYFDFMVNTFKNIESTIKYFKDMGSFVEGDDEDRLF